jgi:hypothetical protein
MDIRMLNRCGSSKRKTPDIHTSFVAKIRYGFFLGIFLKIIVRKYIGISTKAVV